MLRLCPVEGAHTPSFLKVDPTKKQVTVFDPSSSGYTTTAHRRNAVAAPKMFAFDAICTQDDSLVRFFSLKFDLLTLTSKVTFH